MAIHFEHAVDVKTSPERAFEVLDDLGQTPSWLVRCTGLEKLTPGPNAVGHKLKYDYKDGGRVGTMDGEIVARTLNERLTCRYADKMMEVTIDFLVTKANGGARLAHTIDIKPKTFFAKLLSPLIRRQLPKQTIGAMERLRSLLETGKAK
jgi:polyketide cyclase/dehydrase/lipid transport protein